MFGIELLKISLSKVKAQGLRKARIFLREKPAGASTFSRIFSNMEVRGTLYILKDIREYGVKAKIGGLFPTVRPYAIGR